MARSRGGLLDAYLDALRRVPTYGYMVYKLEKQSRLPEYDYSTKGFYLVTVCVKDKKYLLGRVEAGTMWLSRIGEIARGFLAGDTEAV